MEATQSAGDCVQTGVHTPHLKKDCAIQLQPILKTNMCIKIVTHYVIHILCNSHIWSGQLDDFSIPSQIMQPLL